MEEIKISSFFTKTFKWKKARDGILRKIWLSIRWLHPRFERLEIFFKPIHTEFDGALAMRWIGQTMVCTPDHMNLFGWMQTVEDSQGLIQRNKFIFLSMND